MLTTLFLPSVWTTNGIALARPQSPGCRCRSSRRRSAPCSRVIASSSANELFWFVSTQTSFVVVSQRTAKIPLEPAGLPSRLTSLPTSPPRRGSRSLKTADAIRAGGGRRVGDALERERRSAHLGLHVDPGRVVVGERVGAGHPVDDLALAGARREQARMVERDAGVDDADRDAAPVPGRVGGDELRGARVADRHVRVVIRRRRAGRRLRRRVHRALRARIRHLDGLVDVERLDARELRCLLDLVERRCWRGCNRAPHRDTGSSPRALRARGSRRSPRRPWQRRGPRSRSCLGLEPRRRAAARAWSVVRRCHWRRSPAPL